jgi:hypothetical protein
MGIARTITFSFYVLPHKRKGWFSFSQNMGQLGISKTIKSVFYRPDVDTRLSNGVGCDRAGWCTGNGAQVGSNGVRFDSWPGPTIRSEGLGDLSQFQQEKSFDDTTSMSRPFFFSNSAFTDDPTVGSV